VTDDIATIRDALDESMRLGRRQSGRLIKRTNEGLDALDRVAARLADTVDHQDHYLALVEIRELRERLEQAEQERDKEGKLACDEAMARGAAEARVRELKKVLGAINEQATRRKRATNEHEYLVRDLEFIEARVSAVLAAHTKEEE
jgi:hypothetical protein